MLMNYIQVNKTLRINEKYQSNKQIEVLKELELKAYRYINNKKWD